MVLDRFEVDCDEPFGLDPSKITTDMMFEGSFRIKHDRFLGSPPEDRTMPGSLIPIAVSFNGKEGQ